MIFIDIDGLLNVYEARSGKKFTISDLAKETGITRKALSWLKNHPTSSISSEHLGTIAQCFFFRLLPFTKEGCNPAILMDWILRILIQVYPDHPAYRTKEMMSEEVTGIPAPIAFLMPNMLWNSHTLEKYGSEAYRVRNQQFKDLYDHIFDTKSSGDSQPKSKDKSTKASK